MNTLGTHATFPTAPTMAYSLRTMDHALSAGRWLGRLIMRLADKR